LKTVTTELQRLVCFVVFFFHTDRFSDGTYHFECK
jgi:hypothetical protein